MLQSPPREIEGAIPVILRRERFTRVGTVIARVNLVGRTTQLRVPHKKLDGYGFTAPRTRAAIEIEDEMLHARIILWNCSQMGESRLQFPKLERLNCVLKDEACNRVVRGN